MLAQTIGSDPDGRIISAKVFDSNYTTYGNFFDACRLVLRKKSS